jgi:hypothetical protein
MCADEHSKFGGRLNTLAPRETNFGFGKLFDLLGCEAK